MQDDEKIIDVGDNEEQEQEIDLDAVAPEQSLEEEQIDVEQVSEESVSSPKESAEQSDVQKSELNEYSEGVNKRIAKLTRKMREAERQKEEAIAYAQSVQQHATKLKTQNESLGKNYATELEQKVTAGMAAAKANLKTATEAGDIDAQVDAQRAIAQLSMEEGRLRQIQNLQEEKKQRIAERPQQEVNQFAQQVPTSQELYQAAQEIDPKAEDWSTRNSWFGTDNAMTYTAFDIHRKLVEEEGFDPSSQEYYSEVDRRIRLEFPHKFDKVVESAEAPSQAPVQNVASAKRPAAKGRRKTVKLTPSQVAISKRLGVPLEEYAKQLAAKEV